VFEITAGDLEFPLRHSYANNTNINVSLCTQTANNYLINCEQKKTVMKPSPKSAVSSQSQISDAS